jgi:DNA-binding SARP family transcriptional activator
VEIHLLGPVELVLDGEPVALPAKPRALLTLLALRRNEVVSMDRIVEDLWEGDPPETAVKAAQIYVSQLRKLVGERLESRAPGYRLRVEPGELDVDRFEELAAEDDDLAALDEALALWRGPALADVSDLAFARAEAERLEERRAEVLELHAGALLDAGRTPAAIDELERLVRDHPLREGPHELLMRALYRAGRQAEALDVYRRLRERLDEELGLAPSPRLRDLELAILRQDPALEAPRAAAPIDSASAQPYERASTPWPRILWPLATVLLAVLPIAGLFFGTHHHDAANGSALRPFVAKLENFLTQSSEGRGQVVALVHDARACTLQPKEALVKLDLVELNRQSLLDQVAALNVPDDRAAFDASDLLQKAIQASIAADLTYHGWLQQADGCPTGAPPTNAADRRAQRAKDAFVAVFNPLARRYGDAEWDPHRF